jgi:hypothetical protein
MLPGSPAAERKRGTSQRKSNQSRREEASSVESGPFPRWLVTFMAICLRPSAEFLALAWPSASRFITTPPPALLIGVRYVLRAVIEEDAAKSPPARFDLSTQLISLRLADPS